MRRLLMAVAVVTASMLFPAAALAHAPFRPDFFEIVGRPLAGLPSVPCLGSEGWFSTTFDSTPDGGRSTLFAQTSDNTLRAHVHGTARAHFWVGGGAGGAAEFDPHVYDATIDLRLNDIVTPNLPGEVPPQGLGVVHPIVIDLIPSAGGPSVAVRIDIATSVIFQPVDNSIGISIQEGIPNCA